MIKSYLLIVSSLAIVSGVEAYAKAVSSIYDSQYKSLPGLLIIEDASQLNNLYYQSTVYRLNSASVFNSAKGTYEERPGMTHQMITDAGRRYSLYTLKFKLKQPSLLKLQSIEGEASAENSNARIVGPAPVCGVVLAEGESNSEKASDQKDIVIKYSLPISKERRCSTPAEVSTLTIQYKVPIEHEPMVAKTLLSDASAIIPPLKLLIPQKFKDHVVVEFDAEAALNELQDMAGLSGEFHGVLAKVEGRIHKMYSRLAIVAGVNRDCQNSDKTVCDRLESAAVEILKSILISFVPKQPEADKPGNAPKSEKTSGEGEKAVTVQLKLDRETARRQGKIRVDLSDQNYGAIDVPVSFDMEGASASLLDPEILKLMGE